MKERATRSLADRQEDVDHRNAIMYVDVAPLNPFLALDCPALNPKSNEFSSKLWFESITELHRREPDKYPSRATSVSYRDLSVHGYKTSTDYQHTFGNYPAALLHKAFGRGKTQVTILSNVDGLAKQGEMLLVLGRPGSGCSTLLKTLAGEMHSLHLGNTSDVRYNGLSAKAMRKDFRGECIYQAEQDTHFPELTVRETLAFAAAARVPRNRFPGVTRTRYVEHVSDAAMAMFNLSKAAETKVGDDLIRGVSGGERKRVSIAEVFIGGSPLQCWDNSTRGLDSSTALSFVKLLRTSTRTAATTSIVSAYQVSQPMYDEFDKVALLYEGRQIYFGPAGSAKEFFLELGFVCAERATTADFLTSLTNPPERIIRAGYELRVPRTSEEFEKVWRTSVDRARLLQEIEDSRLDQQARKVEMLMPRHSPYTLSFSRQTEICMIRGFQRLRNNFSVPISAIVGNAILGTIIGSVFYNLQPDTSSFYGRGVLIFFATLLNATSSAFEVLTMWAQRTIVTKHTRYAFYHPSAEAVASMICDLPNKLLTSLFFNLILYFMTNLRRTPGAFFTFYLFSFTCLLTMSMFFRMVGLLSRTHAQAMAPVAVWILNLIISTGFVLSPRDLKPWLGWIGFINPMAYTFESLMMNEFHDRRFPCSTVVPAGPAYTDLSEGESICTAIGAVSGQTYVDGEVYLASGYDYNPSHLWRNLGFIIAFMVFFCFIHLMAAEFVSPQRPKGDVLIFRRSRNLSKARNKDVEEKPAFTGSANSKDLKYVEDSDHIYDVPLGIEKHTSILTWDGLSYDIKIKNKARRLLDQVDGWVKPGSLTALMGATSAGKTTLLNVLANRASIGIVTGQVLVDGHLRSEGFARETGYVQQADIHITTSTVREALKFSAALRQPSTISTKEKLIYVDEVIEALEMESYADAVIGVPGDGLNIEQRRRLSIAVEMAAKPALLLFLDEPTSGLDSQTAWSICKLLRKLANSGQAILCTIHQPSAVLFQTFDRLLLLGYGGKPIYFGEIGSGGTVVTGYFESHGARPCREEENPAEWLLDVVGAVVGSKNTKNWSEIWRNSTQKKEVKNHVADLTGELSALPTKQDDKAREEYAVSFIAQVWAVTLRNFEQDWRIPSYLYSKILLSTGTAFFIGFSFWMCPTSIQGVQNQIFSIFLLMIIFSNLTQLIMEKFVHNRALFEARERASKIYSWRVFLSSTIIAEIPSQSVIAVLVFVCWYYPIGMFQNTGPDTSERGALMFLLIWCYCIFTSTFSYMMVAGIEHASTAVNLAQLLYMLSLIFCGVLVRPSALRNFWIFMNRVSPLTYLIGGMATAGLANTPITCTSLELLEINAPSDQSCGQYLAAYLREAGGRILNPDAVGMCEFCPIAETNDVLAAVGTFYGERWRNVGLMLAYVAFNVAGAFVLHWLGRERNR